MLLRCFVPGLPRPKGSHSAFPIKGKDGRRRIIVTSSPSLRRWEHLVAEYLRVTRGRTPTSTQAIEIIVGFFFRRPKTGKNAIANTNNSDWHTHAPDLDKLIRAILDAGTKAGIYRDDGQVCIITATKRYVMDNQGVEITIRTTG